jgi:ubiquinone/menaquinone biosynthesis C-methylase UbiE
MSTDLNKFKDNLTWEEKAKQNPLFAVMSDEIFKDSGTTFTSEQLTVFYHQGERFWKRWLQSLLWDKENISSLSILEYGCGMGRIINQAAEAGLKSAGVDISASQLEYAKNFCPNAEKIEFILLNEEGLVPRESEQFDIVYSYAVLQHIKQSSALKKAIKEICRMTKKNGTVKVQLRGQDNNLSRDAYSNFSALNFENSSLYFYFKKVGFLFLPVIKYKKHTNWVGACIYYNAKTLIKLFEQNGVKINQTDFDAENKVIWFNGIKK